MCTGQAVTKCTLVHMCVTYCCKLKIMVACIWRAGSNKGGVMAISHANITYSTIKDSCSDATIIAPQQHYAVH